MADPNVELLARVATALGDLRERVTFVGGCATALLITDPAAAPVRVADAPSFIATKLEAFLDRGGGDYLSSHDLEDVLSVVDGRAELVAELGRAPPELRAFVAQTLARLLGDQGFDNALPGLVIDASPAVRTPVVRERLRAIAAMCAGKENGV